jgi:hypothetical protein
MIILKHCFIMFVHPEKLLQPLIIIPNYATALHNKVKYLMNICTVKPLCSGQPWEMKNYAL